MEYFTARNTAILALAQVGVIVAGVLAAGAVQKWYATAELRSPASTALVAERGYLALVLPVGWAALALLLLQRGEDHDAARCVAFVSGVLVLLLLLVGVGHSAAAPMLRLLSGCCSLGLT